jgi:hypothetical protein
VLTTASELDDEIELDDPFCEEMITTTCLKLLVTEITVTLRRPE